MNKRTKIVILLAAIVISLVGFNLMVPSGTLDIVRLGQPQAYHVDVTVTAKADSASLPQVHIVG